jgi:acyl-coenzyme A synthetase/AMP-(fatty) acid ligase
MVALFGALKAGTPFIPLDERQPETAIRDLVAHVGPAAVLLHDAGMGKLAAKLGLPIIQGPEHYPLRETVAKFSPVPVSTSAIAYFRFTSGSTGSPKVVPVIFAAE